MQNGLALALAVFAQQEKNTGCGRFGPSNWRGLRTQKNTYFKQSFVQILLAGVTKLPSTAVGAMGAAAGGWTEGTRPPRSKF